MNAKKLAALMLMLMMLVPTLVSCGEAADETAETTAADAAETTTAAEVTEPSRENTPDTLPELDFDGAEVNLLYRDHERYRKDLVGDNEGDIVSDAVYNRNLSVEERLNVKFKLIAGDESASPYCNMIKTAVLAGDDVYDLVSAYQAYSIPMVLENCFMNLRDAEYLDFSQPWWNTDYMTEILVGDDNLYFMQGDIALFMLKSMSAVYFNKALYEGQYGDPSELYELVESGDWTFDEFGVMAEAAYTDLNGDGTADVDDMYGFAATTSKTTEHFMYDAGIRSTSRDADGIPQIAINTPRTVAFMEDFYSLYYENKGAFISKTDNDLDTVFLNMFTGDRMLFLPGWLYMAELLRDMESDYGIIPFPKYDDSEESYAALVHDGTTIYCVPATCGDFDITCAVAEAIAAESYRTVTPAYYEVALKTKYTRDDISSRILDMIYSSATTDFLYANNYSMDGTMIGLLCRTMMQKQTSDFASTYASVESKAQAAFDKLIAIYQETN